jgi:hypothetical protein
LGIILIYCVAGLHGSVLENGRRIAEKTKLVLGMFIPDTPLDAPQ